VIESLAIVVPAYNEARNLTIVIEQVVRLAESALKDYEIIVVDDGSTDETKSVAQELARRFSRVSVLSNARNLGSGGAILAGVAGARCDLVMYIPADGQFHLPEITDFLRAIESCDIVIGARIKRGDYSWFRRLSSRVFIFLVNRLFDQDFRDVNWVHMWRRRIFEKVKPRSRGVFLLEEILVRARRFGFSIAEIQSCYIPRISGRAKGGQPWTILKTIFEMGRFWIEFRRGSKRA
jgi:glycosyltransferase involved in cell wall biosynthesis